MFFFNWFKKTPKNNSERSRYGMIDLSLRSQQRQLLGLKDTWNYKKLHISSDPKLLSILERSFYQFRSYNHGWNNFQIMLPNFGMDIPTSVRHALKLFKELKLEFDVYCITIL